MAEAPTASAAGDWTTLHAAHDPLAECLAWFTRREHRPRSAETLVAGFPLVDNRLTPELFIRAAERAGFSARLVRRPLGNISPHVLPAVILLDGLDACVLLGIHDDGSCTIAQAETLDTEQHVPLSELEARYVGAAIYVKPISRPETSVHSKTWLDSNHWFWSAIRNERAIYVEVVVASLLINVFALAAPLFVMNVYDRVVPNAAMETLWVLAFGVGIVYVFDLLMKTLRTYFVDAAGRHADITMSSHVFEHVMDLQLAARPASVGSFANQLQEFEIFRDFFTSATLVTLMDLPFVVIFLLVIWFIGGPVALVPCVAIPIILLTGLLVQTPLRRLVEQSFKAAARKHAVLIETLAGFEAVKTLRAQSALQARWESQTGHLARIGQRSRLLSSTAVNIAMFVQQIAYVGVVVYGVYIIRDGGLTLGGLIACTILTGRALMPMAQVAQLLVRAQQSLSAYRSVDGIMRLPVERPAEKSFISRPELHGEIEFRDVTFRYPGQPAPAVQEMSFAIKAGERVGIIGRMGSGKTTIQKLILGLYQPDSGAIFMDGADLRQIDPVDLRDKIGYVPQEVVLFGGTVRDNITFGAPPVDDAAVLRAADIAGIADNIRQHPNGFDLAVGERGAGLSGGQRQGIAIARAVLLSPRILLLDEPTNSLDHSTEEQFKRRLAEELGSSTLVMVTHKATPLALVDRLIVVDGGRRVADGPRDKVLELLAGRKISVVRP